MSLNTLNRYKYSRAAIAQAVKVLKIGSGASPSFILAHPKAFQAKGTKLYQGKRWVGPLEEKEQFLRKLLYENKNDYPFGRDSLFYRLKKEVVGLTKRDIESFLNKQQVIVARRSRPKEEKRDFVSRVRKAGILQGDLAHIRPEDLPDDYMPDIQGTARHTAYKPGVKMKNVWKGVRGDRYFYVLVDRFTGYMVVEVVSTKAENVIAKVTKRLVKKMATALGVPIKSISFDQGTEFFQSQRELKASGITTRRVRTNAVVENANAKLQRIFYTLVAQKRAGFKATVSQAVDIANNTLNRRIKITPAEAVKSLRLGEEVKRQKQPLKRPADIKKKAFRVGTKVRALKTKRAKTKAGFKTYKGNHFGPVQTITKVTWYQGFPKYELDSLKRTKHGVSMLAWHDEVIRASDADKISKQLLAGRKVQFDEAPKKKVRVDPKIPKHAKRQRAKFRIGQPVWYENPLYKKRYDAKITHIDWKKKLAAVEYKDRGQMYDDTNVLFVYLKPKA